MSQEIVIAVYGASGHTGRFVARELRNRGVPTILVTRREASCDDPHSLDRALKGSSAVINCAGPFVETAPAVVESALRLGIHYIDVTAEQRTALQTFETYRELARERNVAILPAMAFFGGLADLLATAITKDARAVDDIAIAVALDSWHPTAGTRATGERNTARRWIVSDGKLAPLPDPSPSMKWRFDEPFGEQEMVAVPLSEIIAISRHSGARTIASYMNAPPLRDLRDAATPAPAAIDASGRSAQRFAMEVAATCDGRRRRMTATGQDIYAVTAPLAVEACLRVVSNPPSRGGTFAAGEIFDAANVLAAMRPAIETSPLRSSRIHAQG